LSRPDAAVVLRRGPGPWLLLLAAAVLSVGALGAAPHEAFQLPLAAVLAALLPLQLAALFYVYRRPYRG
jgi:hypothetical protein